MNRAIHLRTIITIFVLASLAEKCFGSMNFDGSNDFIDFGDITSVNFGSGDFTISMWLYNTDQTTRDAPMTKDAFPTANSRQLIILLNSNEAGIVTAGRIGMTYFQDDTTIFCRLSTTGVVPQNLWTHTAFVRSAGTLSIWINGTSVSTTIDSTCLGAENLSIADGNSSLQIGARAGASSIPDYYSGQIDDVRIYRRALSTSEIQTLALSRTRVLLNTDNLVNYWRLDEGSEVQTSSGAAVIDHGTSKNAGTPTNAPTWKAGFLGYP